MKEVLTPSESLDFILFNKLPPRVYYNEKEKAYFVKGHKRKSDNGNLVAMPRWQYLLGRMTPTLPDFPSLSDLPGLPSLPSFSDLPSMPSLPSMPGLPSMPSLPKSSGSSDPSGSPSLPSFNAGDFMDKLRTGYDALSSLKSYYTDKADPTDKADDDGAAGADGGTDNGKENDDKDGNDDGGKDEDNYENTYKPYVEYAMAILTSDLGQMAFKTGMSFVPGGSAILNAYETGSKAYEAYNKMEDTKEKLPL